MIIRHELGMPARPQKATSEFFVLALHTSGYNEISNISHRTRIVADHCQGSCAMFSQDFLPLPSLVSLAARGLFRRMST